jgi:hypothetical protein
MLVKLVKETNVPDPLAPIELHVVVPGSEITGELMRPVEVGMRMAVDVKDSTVKDIDGGIMMTTPVTAIQETDETNVKRITTCNSVYLVTYL